VDDRGRDVRPAAIGAPRDRLAARPIALERDVTRGAGLDRVNRLDAGIPVGHDHYAGADDRRRNRDLGVAAEAPELLAGRRIVAADEGRRLSDELGPAVVLEDGRRGP